MVTKYSGPLDPEYESDRDALYLITVTPITGNTRSFLGELNNMSWDRKSGKHKRLRSMVKESVTVRQLMQLKRAKMLDYIGYIEVKPITCTTAYRDSPICQYMTGMSGK